MSQATDKDGKAVDTDSVYEKQPSGNTAGLEPDANVWSGNVECDKHPLEKQGPASKKSCHNNIWLVNTPPTNTTGGTSGASFDFFDKPFGLSGAFVNSSGQQRSQDTANVSTCNQTVIPSVSMPTAASKSFQLTGTEGPALCRGVEDNDDANVNMGTVSADLVPSTGASSKQLTGMCSQP